MSGCVVVFAPVAAAGMLAAGKPGLACAWGALTPGSPLMVPNGSLGIPAGSLEIPDGFLEFPAGNSGACADGSGLGAAAGSSSCCSSEDPSCATRCLCKCCCQLTSVLRRVSTVSSWCLSANCISSWGLCWQPYMCGMYTTVNQHLVCLQTDV